MMRELLEPGLRAFTVACGLTLLVAVLHTLGLAGDPADARWAAVLDDMRGATVAAGAFHFTLYGVFESVWIQVGALLAMMAGKSLLIVGVVPREARAPVVRAVSLFDAACYAVLTGLFVDYEIPPPLISFAVLTLAFSLAAALSSRRPAAPAD